MKKLVVDSSAAGRLDQRTTYGSWVLEISKKEPVLCCLLEIKEDSQNWLPNNRNIDLLT